MIRKLHRAPDPELDAQLDLILKHLHDDRYALLSHEHEELYPLKTEIYTKAEMDAIISGSVRPGTIAFAIRSTPWPGFLEADGSELLREEYPDLWAEAQSSGCLVNEATWAANNWGCYSSGDGSTTFRIPDLRGEFIRCWDNGKGVDPDRQLGSNQEDAFQGHWHEIAGRGDSHEGWNGVYYVGDINPNVARAKDIVSDGINGTPRTASETRPRNIALFGMIKY